MWWRSNMSVTSPVYEMNSNGPRTEPWGALQFTRMALESFPFARNSCERSDGWNHVRADTWWKTVPVVPAPAVVRCGRQCQTLSSGPAEPAPSRHPHRPHRRTDDVIQQHADDRGLSRVIFTINRLHLWEQNVTVSVVNKSHLDNPFNQFR